MYCNALKVLKERGFVEWSSHNEELDEHFSNNMVTGYIGFDLVPTASVGNLVAIMGLAWMQRLGHRPIALAGGGNRTDRRSFRQERREETSFQKK